MALQHFTTHLLEAFLPRSTWILELIHQDRIRKEEERGKGGNSPKIAREGRRRLVAGQDGAGEEEGVVDRVVRREEEKIRQRRRRRRQRLVGTKTRTRRRGSGWTMRRGDDVVERTTRGRGGADGEVAPRTAWMTTRGGGATHLLDDDEERRRGGEADGEGVWWGAGDVVERMGRSGGASTREERGRTGRRRQESRGGEREPRGKRVARVETP
jgi:hypothetical protein